MALEQFSAITDELKKMNRSKIEEFHFITHIENLPSIMKVGILCYNKVKSEKHHSIAMNDIQERRENVRLPNGKPLHEYANLYFHARNPMMYKRKEAHASICVLRIKHQILDVPGVFVTDKNASSPIAIFASPPEGLANVNEELTFSMNWNDANEIVKTRKKLAKCAEVLVPGYIPPVWIMGGYVSCKAAFDAVNVLGLKLELTINPKLFFL